MKQTNKSFYYAYFYSQAGGGFFETDFCTTNRDNLEGWLYYMLASEPHLVFFYGVFASVVQIEDGKIVALAEDILEKITLEIKGLEGVKFSYLPQEKEGFEYPDNKGEYASFLPVEGVFYAKLNEEQTLYLQEFTHNFQFKDKNPCIEMNLDWKEIGITELAGKHLLQADEEISLDELADLPEISHPIRLGSFFNDEESEKIMERVRRFMGDY
ncbi:hypothetical protein [Hugenholtzia roseola]|uniref:hypothetical protein n=1 Tax=Hugenholtzia roseola TaxID=1002 RepID=UPI0003FBBDA8|nr:hypothetical protein [Hugenholtzia roseola]